MSMRKRGRARRREALVAKIDMNSLIDLTFLLLVVFIVTLPTLEQSVHVVLPTGKTNKAQTDKTKTVSVSIDKFGKLFIGEAPTTHDDLKASLEKSVAADPEVNVLIRGDIGASYGDVYDVVKIAKDCNVKHLGLVSKEN
ncbi:MAG: biopolymer transporter ExbD [Kiritimatiellae bacterium]|nr:biopolymer transporter ExbD [Kiritimatiellia bacterium]